MLSVPRDTVTDLPACRTPKGGTVPARRGPLNSTLRYGPGCTVAAVHGLTRLPIDHFVLADFAGVVRMSDAVGGVPVCVDRDVYDPYSGLRLTAGRHLVRGRGALAFLRSRHAFGDGGDLGRADAQHLFLGALAVRMRDAGAFADPAGLLALAQAATGALTVDPGLASLSRLAGLAADLRKVPPEQMVFTTVPTRPDPRDRDRLVPGPGADRVFALIASDLPLRVSGPPATPRTRRRRPRTRAPRVRPRPTAARCRRARGPTGPPPARTAAASRPRCGAPAPRPPPPVIPPGTRGTPRSAPGSVASRTPRPTPAGPTSRPARPGPHRP